MKFGEMVLFQRQPPLQPCLISLHLPALYRQKAVVSVM